MRLKQKVRKIARKVQRFPRKYTIPSAVLIVFILLSGIVFFIEKPVIFSYGGSTCEKYFSLFPATQRLSDNFGYEATLTDEMKIGNIVIASRSICFTPKQTPVEGVSRVSLSPWGGVIARKTFAITAGQLPQMSTEIFEKPISTSKPLQIPLNVPDTTFSYHLKANNREIDCPPSENAIFCDIKSLGLKQGKNYKIAVTRQFADSPAMTLVEKDVKTLSATRVTYTTIKSKKTIYGIPKSLSLTFDKEIVKAATTLYRLKDKRQIKIDTTQSIAGTKLKVTFSKNLPRHSNYQLVTTDVEATDGSGLEDPHKLAFKMSGGPKVTGVNIGTTGVSNGTTVAVTFDQAISAKQAVGDIIHTSGGAKYIGRSGSKLFFSVANVKRCGSFTLSIAKGLKSKYGIASTAPWQYTSRTICHTISTIGYSSQGRPINAYFFGSGGVSVLYTGAIHGNETSTYYLMNAWIQDLEANARSIPSNKTIVVVPTLNPDGFASGSRTNARNVDLNRNFATSDWKKDITTVNNKPFKGGGGRAPMSEPETKAIAALAQRIRPALVLSYHSIGGVLAANQAGRSNSLASDYSRQSGYANTTGQTSETFEYSISGTADDWYAQQLGVASILIELGSHSYHEFERNKNAMWAMARL